MNIKIGTYEFNTADSWNELPIELLEPAYLILKADIPSITRLAEFTKLLLNIGADFLKQWCEWSITNHGVENGEAIWLEDWSKIVTAVTTPFIEKIEPVKGSHKLIQFQIDMSFTRCVFPVLNFNTKAGVRKLYACTDAFKNMTIGELARVDNYVQQYLVTGDVSNINKCIALIYREHKQNSKENRRKGYDGDVREKMQHVKHNEIKRERIVQELLTDGGRKLLWFWITSCREQIFRKWKNVLNPETTTKKTYWDKQLAKYGWAGLFIELAKGSSMTENEVSELNYEEVFVKLAYLETKRKAVKVATKQ